MTDYASSTDLGYLTAALGASATTNGKAYAIEAATTWVNSFNVSGLTTASVPDLVEKAATYYAYSFLLRNLYDVSVDDTPMAAWYEKEAFRLMNSYIASVASEESTAHPYGSSKTPTRAYMGRHTRTTYDDTDYDYIDDTTNTTSED